MPLLALQSALFDFSSFVTVVLLFICACAFLHGKAPRLLDNHKKGFTGIFWKAARIGERLSPWVGIACVVMGLHTLFIKV